MDSAEAHTGLADVLSLRYPYLIDQKTVKILVLASSWILQNGDASGAENHGGSLGNPLMVLSLSLLSVPLLPSSPVSATTLSS